MPSSYHDARRAHGLFDGPSPQDLTSGSSGLNTLPKELVIYMSRRASFPAVVLLLCVLGWAAPGAGPVRGAGGPGSGPGAGDPAAPVVQGTKPVQAPPLQAPPLEPAPGNPVVVIATSHGEIVIELFREEAPVSVENFLQYARDGFYDGTIFHRVVPRFMIQGGGYTPSLVEKPTRPPIQNEATNGLRNRRGTVAMARRQTLRSATAQFYINVADNRMLDHTGYSPADFGYAVFGRVLHGLDVADAIAAVPTGVKGGMSDVPLDPVIIKTVRLAEEPDGVRRK
jgi:cyclophilin family peptidyl-prolyl cis-trans isomerase